MKMYDTLCKAFGACLVSFVAAAAEATDYTWLANPESSAWLTGVNWSAGGSACQWVAGSDDTATFGTSSETEIALGGTASVTNFVVKDADYGFSGGKINVDGEFRVGSGHTVTVKSALTQTSTDRRFAKEGAGTLVLEGDAAHTNTFNRFAVRGGTMVISGGVHRVTAGAKTAKEPLMAGSLYGGSSFTLTGGARFTFDGTSSYIANSGCVTLITNATLDCWNAGEVLHGFQDHGIGGPSTLTIADGGTMIANSIRLGKLTKTNARTDYGHTYLNCGGRLVLHNFSMDTAWDISCKGAIHFDGGILSITNKSGEGASTTFVINDYAGPSWSNSVFAIREGGAWIEPKALGNQNYRRPFTRDTGVETDGGLHVTNSNSSSLSAFLSDESTYNGGFWLHGGRATICGDGSLGAVPETPSDNIRFLCGATRNNYLGLNGNMELSPNRRIYIGDGAKAEIGTYAGKVGRIRGTIFGESNSVFQCAQNDAGYTYLDPGEGKTNYVGKLNAYGKLVLASGTTVVTSNSHYQAQSGKESLHVFGSGSSPITDRLILAGGDLKVTHRNYVNVEGYARAVITNGHFDAELGYEYLNGLGSPAETFVAGKGVLTATMVRISQQSTRDGNGNPLTGVTVATGGVIRTQQIRIDENQPNQRGYIAFDGGTLQAREIDEPARFGNFIGLSATTANTVRWTNQQVRVCAGGAIIDSNGRDVKVHAPFWSWAENDGGLTKRGAGKLTVANRTGLEYPYAGRTSANSYNGVTRVEQGTLEFTLENGGFPGGDIAYTAEGLATGSPLLQLPTLVQREGKGIVIENADKLDPAAFRGSMGILSLTKDGAAIASVPPVKFVASDGTVLSQNNGWNNWTLSLADSGRKLSFCYHRGLMMIIK